jgi:hypothetical protein
MAGDGEERARDGDLVDGVRTRARGESAEMGRENGCGSGGF